MYPIMKSHTAKPGYIMMLILCFFYVLPHLNILKIMDLSMFQKMLLSFLLYNPFSQFFQIKEEAVWSSLDKILNDYKQ